MNQAPYLLGKIADPLFAIAIGTLSYYSYERKVGRPEGHSLNELISKRFSKNIWYKHLFRLEWQGNVYDLNYNNNNNNNVCV